MPRFRVPAVPETLGAAGDCGAVEAVLEGSQSSSLGARSGARSQLPPLPAQPMPGAEQHRSRSRPCPACHQQSCLLRPWGWGCLPDDKALSQPCVHPGPGPALGEALRNQQTQRVAALLQQTSPNSNTVAQRARDSLFPSPLQDLKGMHLQHGVATPAVRPRRGPRVLAASVPPNWVLISPRHKGSVPS